MCKFISLPIYVSELVVAWKKIHMNIWQKIYLDRYEVNDKHKAVF